MQRPMKVRAEFVQSPQDSAAMIRPGNASLPEGAAHGRRRLSIGAVLVIMQLTVLLLPITGVWVLRLYESALIRQTESSLITEAAITAAAFRGAWRASGGQPDAAGPRVDRRWTHQPGFAEPWLPRFAKLDLAVDPVLPPPPDGKPADAAPDEAARKAGEIIAPLIRESQLVTLAGVRVLDRNGVAVASTGETPVVGMSFAEQSEVRRVLRGEPVSVLRARTVSQGFWDNGGAARVFTALPVLDEQRVVGAVVAWRTPPSIRQALFGKRRSLALLALLTLAAVGGFGVFGALTISRPLRAVTEQAKRTANGERGVMSQAGGASVREVGELSQALSRMAATLEQRADYIRDFASHVSHEFKTPLATIRGTVELLREHIADMSAEDREQFLANLDAEAERLARLVTRLLELARADVMGAAPEHGGGADAAKVIGRVVERWRREGMAIDMDIDKSARVVIGEEALEMMLINLFNNARQHAGSQARITVSLRKTDDGGQAALTVTDDGPGVSAANAERIFAPFFTTARMNGGTGLGLSIVQSLAAAHGGSVRLAPSARGAAFEVRLPCAAAGE